MLFLIFSIFIIKLYKALYLFTLPLPMPYLPFTVSIYATGVPLKSICHYNRSMNRGNFLTNVIKNIVVHNTWTDSNEKQILFNSKTN